MLSSCRWGDYSTGVSLAASLAHDGREFRTEVSPNSAAAVQHRQHSEDGNFGLNDSEISAVLAQVYF